MVLLWLNWPLLFAKMTTDDHWVPISLFQNSLCLSIFTFLSNFPSKNVSTLLIIAWGIFLKIILATFVASTYGRIDFIFLISATKNPIDKFLASSQIRLAINFCCHFSDRGFCTTFVFVSL